MAIRFVAKTAEDLEPKAVAPTPVIADAPAIEAPAPVKPVKASKSKFKGGARNATEPKAQ
jgi:hypothetical protein